MQRTLSFSLVAGWTSNGDDHTTRHRAFSRLWFAVVAKGRGMWSLSGRFDWVCFDLLRYGDVSRCSICLSYDIFFFLGQVLVEY